MKMNRFGLALLSLMLTASTFQTQAQVSFSLNLGLRPTWGPAVSDRSDYYYLPDIETYYNVNNHQFIYMNNGHWVFSASLPYRYRNYDLYSGYKVVVNRPRPYLNFRNDRVQYARYKGFHNQQENFRDHNNRSDHRDNQGDHRDDHRDNGDHRDDHRDNGGDHRDGGDHGDHGGDHKDGDHHDGH